MKKIKVLFDKTSEKKLKIGWGVSFLIDTSLIFDTGENGKYLLENIKNLNIDIEKVERVVISHNHWDHTGGLWELLKKKKLAVYSCKNFSNEFKKKVKESGGKLVEIKNSVEIEKNIYTTGEIEAYYKDSPMPEQSLILKTENGLTILTGCSHPGILNILEIVKKKFPEEKIYAVIGGFHLIEEDKRVIEYIVNQFMKMGVEKAGPTHCSGTKTENIFREKYGKNFIKVKVGDEIIV